MTEDSPGKKGLTVDRIKQEMREYAIISLYLWVCFSVILVYQSSLSPRGDALYVLLGSAAFKALLIGKFILIGKALKPGSRRNPRMLLARIAWKSLAMLAVLIAFNLLEELVVGAVHGQTLAQSVSEYLGRPTVQLIAPMLLMLLVLIPMIAFEEVDRELGRGTLRELLFGQSSAE